MTGYRVSRRAGDRLDDIYRHTREHWGEAQAERYVQGLFARFAEIAARAFPWRPVPAEFGVDGYVCRHEHHYIYWRVLGDGSVGIVTVLHERMHQSQRLNEDRG